MIIRFVHRAAAAAAGGDSIMLIRVRVEIISNVYRAGLHTHYLHRQISSSITAKAMAIPMTGHDSRTGYVDPCDLDDRRTGLAGA